MSTSATIGNRLSDLGFQPLAGDPAGGRDELPRFAPASLQQAADLLGTCSREGWRVRLEGGGTRTPSPPRAQLVITSQALVGLDVYNPEDLTGGCLAGTPHATFDAVLAEHGQFLPLDPPAAGGSTLGGSMALAAAGPLRAGYGTPRDLALGLHAVTGDGRVLRLGGQVVKNVAGYDLVRLLVGSRGTLAFIAQVHVRLWARPAADATLVAPVRDRGEAAALALEIRDTIHPVALEVLGPHGGHTWRIALRVHGSEAAIADAAARVGRTREGSVLLDADAARALWGELRRAEAAAGTRIRIQGRPADLAALLLLAERLAEPAADAAAGEWSRLAHAADGIIRIHHPARRPPAEDRLAALLPGIAEEAARLNGTCICEAGPAALREAAPPPPPAAAVSRLESELRRRFDPAAILVGD